MSEVTLGEVHNKVGDFDDEKTVRIGWFGMGCWLLWLRFESEGVEHSSGRCNLRR